MPLLDAHDRRVSVETRVGQHGNTRLSFECRNGPVNGTSVFSAGDTVVDVSVVEVRYRRKALACAIDTVCAEQRARHKARVLRRQASLNPNLCERGSPKKQPSATLLSARVQTSMP